MYALLFLNLYFVFQEDISIFIFSCDASYIIICIYGFAGYFAFEDHYFLKKEINKNIKKSNTHAVPFDYIFSLLWGAVINAWNYIFAFMLCFVRDYFIFSYSSVLLCFMFIDLTNYQLPLGC
jgi:hypothetical protein